MRLLRHWAFLLFAAAVLLHLPAHLAPWSTSVTRQQLPEDGPVFVGNTALVTGANESPTAAIRRAWTDEGAAWEGAADVVGRARWRPVAATLFAVERAAPWASTPDSAVAGAAIVSLLLHVLVVLGSALLVMALGGERRAAVIAGLLVAACPAALPAAAWPARQPVVLAAALCVFGTLLALRGGTVRLVVAGLLLALAGLAHEAAFGWAVAVPLLARGRRIAIWPCLVAPAIAFVVRLLILKGFGAPADSPAGSAARGLLDGAAGIVVTITTFLVPARQHFADGPFGFSVLAHAAAVVCLAIVLTLLWKRRELPAATAAIGGVGAMTPLLLVGAAGAAPFQDAYLYLALPLLAAALALAVTDLVARGGAMRAAAASAAALLLGASVAGTLMRAGAFRTREGLVTLANVEMPRSPIARAWDLRLRLDAGALAELTPAVEKLALETGGKDAPKFRGDAVAAATLSQFFVRYADALWSSEEPGWSSAFDAAGAGAVTATELRPLDARTWSSLAALRMKAGQNKGAFEASSKAAGLAPDDVVVVSRGAQIAMRVGYPGLSASVMDGAFEIEARRAAEEKREVGAEFLLLYGEALGADGGQRVPDPSADMGFRYRFDLAAEVLTGLLSRRDAPPGTRAKLYNVYLRYGDFLASADRPAMAMLAYAQAVNLTGGNDKSDAGEHGKWLAARLDAEERTAREQIAAADAEPGKPNLANAFVELYIAYCRRQRTKEADEIFDKLAAGGISPELRLHRAVQRFAAFDAPEEQSKAETDLRQVLREKPALARAHYELARVLEWQGTEEKLDEARREYDEAARLGVFETWSLDAAQRAETIGKMLHGAR